MAFFSSRGSHDGSTKRKLRTPDRASRRGRLRLEWLEPRQMFSVTLASLNNIQEPGGKDVLVPLTGVDSSGQPIAYTFTSSDSSVQVSLVSPTSKSLVLNVAGTDKNGQAFTGTLTLHLFEDLAPENTARIEELVGQQFYDGTTLGRVLDGFISQAGFSSTGAPLTTGQKIDDEFVKNLSYTSPGLLAMANAGSDTNDSEFFITAIDTKGTTTPIPMAQMPQFLDYRYTIFGQLVSGFDTFTKIMQTNVTANSIFNNEVSKPTAAITITSATLINDTQNAVLRLSAPTSFNGASSTIQVTATSSTGTTQQSFTVTGVPDVIQNFTDPPFLGSVPANVTTTAGTSTSFTLTSTDVSNGGVVYKVADASTFSTPANVIVSVDQTTGLVTLTPAAGFSGTVSLIAGVKATSATDVQGSYDTQVFTLTVNPAPTTLSIPSVSAQIGSTVSVPINISNAHPTGSSGLQSATLGVTYDPTVFDVSTADISLGSLDAGWTLTPTINTTTGQIAIQLTAPAGTPLTSTAAGSLAVIQFHVKADATLGASLINLAASVQPNGETVVTTQLVDSSQNVLSLTTAPTNGEGGSAVAGTVTVQAVPVGQNLSGLAFATIQTGTTTTQIPLQHVTITISGVDSTGTALSLSQTSVTTGSDGTYSFSLLPAGTYDIKATLPSYLKAGAATAGSAGGTAATGEVSSVALSSSDLTGYNFSATLAPQFVTLNLFLASTPGIAELFNPQPIVTQLADQTVTEGTATPATPFNLGDDLLPAGDLTTTGTSSNTTLVPNANIVYAGTGSQRTITVTPAAGQTGTATITTVVADAFGNQTSVNFTLTVVASSATSSATTLLSAAALPAVTLANSQDTTSGLTGDSTSTGSVDQALADESSWLN